MAVCVLLCRGCCCGTEAKHSDVDHADQERVLRQAAERSGGKLVLTRCLGPCERSNVVVVKTVHGTIWLGGALLPEQTRRVAELVSGVRDPDDAADLVFKIVPRRSRSAAG